MLVRSRYTETAMQAIGDRGGVVVRAKDVILKLKDEGDFDRLRVKIIRKIKENEELRSNIISLVKQSVIFNSPGAENMKPRQLSDAIHQELGDKLMSQISDGVWNIIKSPDGMKMEITKTVESVYDKMTRPYRKDNSEPSSSMNIEPIQNEHDDKRDVNGTSASNGKLLDGEPNEPQVFGHTDQANKSQIPLHNGQVVRGNKEENLHLQEILEPENLNLDVPPGFSHVIKRKKSGDCSDDDPDVPPGFG